jgi:DNA anti-recombination protein RmuC
MVALTRLSKLNKAHRTVVKQQVKALQQAWRSLRPLNQEQQQRLQELKQAHAQHQADVQAALATLVQGLLTVRLANFGNFYAKCPME